MLCFTEHTSTFEHREKEEEKRREGKGGEERRGEGRGGSGDEGRVKRRTKVTSQNATATEHLLLQQETLLPWHSIITTACSIVLTHKYN